MCELLKDLASEEMEDGLNSLLDDIGPLLVLLSKHPSLKQHLETKLTTQFDAILQPRLKLLLYRSLVIVNKKTPCLQFSKLLRHLFSSKVADSAAIELPTLLEKFL